MKLMKAFLIFVVGMVTAFSAASQTSDERFIFRYKTGVGTSAPDIDHPGNFDVAARFFGIVGEPFESRIPTKPGSYVARWEIESGMLPSGLSMDPITGDVTGVPSHSVSASSLAMRGYAPSGGMGTYASVMFDVIEPRANAYRQVFHAHTGSDFSYRIMQSVSDPVQEWRPIIPLPEWARISGSNLDGNPDKAGVFAVALSGVDNNGHEVAFTYGQIVATDGLEVAFVPDQLRHRSSRFAVVPKVGWSFGPVRWETEGERLPGKLSFDFRTGLVKGRIPAFDATARVRFKATDVDGATGYSNWFTIGTYPADVNIRDVRDVNLTVNEPVSRGFFTDDLAGALQWSHVAGDLPPGIHFDEAKGRLRGIPTHAGAWPGVVVAVASADGAAESNPFTIHVHPDSIRGSVPDVHVRLGEDFDTMPAVVAGGTGPYTVSLAEGSELPDGVTFDPDTGTLRGVLSEKGNQSVSLVATDSTGRVGKPFTAGIFGYVPLEAWVSGDVYEGTRLEALSPPITAETPADSVIPQGSWTLQGPALPAGLSFSRRQASIYGTPAVSGSFGPYTMAVEDGSGAIATTAPFMVEIADLPDIEIAVGNIDYPMLVDGAVRAGTVANAVGGWTWTLDDASAQLPPGLRLDPDGFIRGRLTDIEPIEGIVVTVTDSEGRTGISEPFAITPVDPDPVAVSDIEFTWGAGTAFSTPIPHVENVALPLTFDASDLPGWLALDSSTGVLSGAAPEPGEYGPYEILVADELGREGVMQAHLDILEDIDLFLPSFIEVHRSGWLPPTVPDVVNAIGQVAWQLSGQLPDGLSHDPHSGAISGKPIVEGEFPITFSVRDQTGRTATASAILKVGERLPIDVRYDVQELYQGDPYGLPVTPTKPDNAAGEVSYSIVSGILPTGLELDADTGHVFGVPSDAGTWSGVVIRGTDSEGSSDDSGALTFKVTLRGDPEAGPGVAFAVPVDVQFTTPPIPVGNVVAPFRFTPTSGSGLGDPDGIVLDLLTGSFYGKATTTGVRTFQVKVTDDHDRSLVFPVTLTVQPGLEVSMPETVSARQYQPEPLFVPVETGNAIGNVTYGIAPSNGLPGGVHFDTASGALKGTPTEYGSFGPFTVTASDMYGSATASFSLEVAPRHDLEALMGSFEVARYSQVPEGSQPKVENATGTVTYVLTHASGLPSGLGFDSGAGRFVDAPEAEGTYGPFTLTVSDASQTVSRTFTITVKPRLPLEADFTETRYEAFAKHPYSLSPYLMNAVGDVTWSLVSGALPRGLALDPETGLIHGAPEEVGLWENIVLRASDGAGGTATTKAISLEVAIDGTPIALVTSALAVRAGRYFTTVAPQVGNEIGPYYFLSPQATAAGLAFDPADGTMSGSFSTIGTRVIDLEVTDATNRVTSEPQVIDVIPDLKVGYPSVTYAMVTQPMTAIAPVTEYAIGAVTYELDGVLPVGLDFNAATGRITGTPVEQVKREGLVVYAQDASGDRRPSDPFTIDVVDDGSIPAITLKEPPVWKAGADIPAHAPTVKYGKVGDVYAVNKPLPSGLRIDADTGVIHGAPDRGTHGLHEGYTVTVTDVNGRGTTSEPIALKIRHHDDAGLSADTFKYEPNKEFTTPAIMVENPHAIVGGHQFVIVSGGAGLQVDALTGSLTGSLSAAASPRGVRIRLVDDFGTLEEISFRLETRSLGISLGNQTERAGSPVSFVPTVTDAIGPGTSYEMVSKNGVELKGLDFDPDTGTISGAMPVGTYSVRLSVTDNGKTAYAPNKTGWVTLLGYTDVTDPLAGLFIDLDDQEPRQTVVSNILPVGGLGFGESVAATLSDVEGDTKREWRICYDPDCLDVRSDWSATTIRTVRNGEFIQVRLVVPDGSNEARTVRLSHSGKSLDWTVTSRNRGTGSFASIVAGGNFSCGLADGAAKCWGHGGSYRLGNNSLDSVSAPVSVSAPSGSSENISFRKLSIGTLGTHACGVDEAGKAWCWGHGGNYRLGTGKNATERVPAEVVGGHAFVDISAGGSHTCAIRETGGVLCWGQNSYGELGNGEAGSPTTPVSAIGVYKSVSAGTGYTCAIAPNDAAVCWGKNTRGRLGTGSATNTRYPETVAGGHRFTAISAGDEHTCGIRTDGVAMCWGNGENYRLGNNSATSANPVPVEVHGGHRFKRISAGSKHTCGIRTDGVAMCWGSASNGRLGTGNTTTARVPAEVHGGHLFNEISASSTHTCAISTENVTMCWGTGINGQLGNGRTENSLVPVEVID